MVSKAEISEAPFETSGPNMKMFDVQGIEIKAAYERTFSYIANPTHLPLWTNAFATVANGRVMRLDAQHLRVNATARAAGAT